MLAGFPKHIHRLPPKNLYRFTKITQYRFSLPFFTPPLSGDGTALSTPETAINKKRSCVCPTGTNMMMGFGILFVLLRSMKKNVTLLAWMLVGLQPMTASLASAPGNNPQEMAPDTTYRLRKVKHHVFNVGEKLTYRLYYGLIPAGDAVLEVKATDKKAVGREMIHLVGTGKTLGAFDWFYKVRDRYESYIDKEGLFPWVFVRRVDEGGFVIRQDYIFKQNRGMVVTKVAKGNKKKKIKEHPVKDYEVPAAVQDVLSAFYYARTLDFRHAKKGQVFEVNCFLDEEIWPLKVKFLGREHVKTKSGKFHCMKFAPIVQKGRIFKKEEDLTVWITDDENKIPLKAQARVLIGSVTLELTAFENLSNPVALIKD